MSVAGSRPLRVLVDAAILRPDLLGIRTYIDGVVSALSHRADLEVIVATSHPEDLPVDPGVEVIALPRHVQDFGRRALWRERSLHDLVRGTKADVVLAPVPELPVRRLPVPAVMVVHDVKQILAPALGGRLRWLRATLDLPRACAAASVVVCVSHSTLAALHSTVRVDPARCVVIPEAPQLSLDARSRSGHSRDADPFFLYAGALMPHKNVSTLLRAFAPGEPSLRARLVMVGSASLPELRALDRLREELGIGDRVVHLGPVTPERLGELYADALALVSPSLHEGFGLPVLEAMAAGTPALVTELPAFRELAADAARYVVEPLDPGRWRAELARLCDDPAERRALGDQGRERARRYSWERVGERFAEVLLTLTS